MGSGKVCTFSRSRSSAIREEKPMSLSPNLRRRQLRDILAGEKCVFPAPVFDPVSAVLARQEGFEMGMAAGSAISTAVLAAPDIVVLTLTELADQVRRITRASDLPLL